MGQDRLSVCSKDFLNCNAIGRGEASPVYPRNPEFKIGQEGDEFLILTADIFSSKESLWSNNNNNNDNDINNK